MSDTKEFWDEMWSRMDDTGSDSNKLLLAEVSGMPPGRALEIGCGTGGNALWLAKQGWQVTALDFSTVAVDKARKSAASNGVDVGFVVGDASTYQPEGQFDLIATFYIQLFPEQRRQMLTWAVKALAPGGTLLFVSHDRSSPPSGWSEEDLLSLTTPEEIVAELPGLQIEHASQVCGTTVVKAFRLA